MERIHEMGWSGYSEGYWKVLSGWLPYNGRVPFRWHELDIPSLTKEAFRNAFMFDMSIIRIEWLWFGESENSRPPADSSHAKYGKRVFLEL